MFLTLDIGSASSRAFIVPEYRRMWLRNYSSRESKLCTAKVPASYSSKPSLAFQGNDVYHLHTSFERAAESKRPRPTS